ncbi:cell division protein FtsZ, partial [Pseudoflavonifractor phocaeensis]|nr:cell division protein FtsZ [Pseudoflavonifractor phocaeensis]
ATFDDTLEDEVRVTVIATGFEEREDNIPNNLFSNAGEKEKKNREQQAGQEQSEQKKEPAAAAPSADDPFEDIFKIFNRGGR